MTHVVLARIGAPHGLRGSLKVYSYTSPVENIINFKNWWLDEGAKLSCREVKSIHQHDKYFIVNLEGINSREQAQLLVTKEVKVLRSELPQIATNEYYYSDLENLAVYNLQQEYLGTIANCFTTGANDILEIVQGDKQIFVPFIMDQYVMNVDLSQRRVLVDWAVDS